MNGIFRGARADEDQPLEPVTFSFQFEVDAVVDTESNTKTKSKKKKKPKKKQLQEVDSSAIIASETCSSNLPPEKRPSVDDNTSSIGVEPPAELDQSSVQDHPGKKNKGKNKKKKKSNSSKSAADETDELDDILRELALHDAAKSASSSTPQASKNLPNSSRSKGTKDVPSSSSSSNSSSSRGPLYVSWKDPQLDQRSKARVKYGNGKNLVAVGVRKYRDPNWMTAAAGEQSQFGSQYTRAEDAPSIPDTGRSGAFSFGFSSA